MKAEDENSAGLDVREPACANLPEEQGPESDSQERISYVRERIAQESTGQEPELPEKYRVKSFLYVPRNRFLELGLEEIRARVRQVYGGEVTLDSPINYSDITNSYYFKLPPNSDEKLQELIKLIDGVK